MYWTLELASKLEDAPWPATKEELIDYAMRSGAPLEVLENLQGSLRQNITPTRADCRYRAPLSPRLHGSNSIVKMRLYVKWEVFVKDKEVILVVFQLKCNMVLHLP